MSILETCIRKVASNVRAANDGNLIEELLDKLDGPIFELKGIYFVALLKMIKSLVNCGEGGNVLKRRTSPTKYRVEAT